MKSLNKLAKFRRECVNGGPNISGLYYALPLSSIMTLALFVQDAFQMSMISAFLVLILMESTFLLLDYKLSKIKE